MLCSGLFQLILSTLLKPGISFAMGRWLSHVFNSMSLEDADQQLPVADGKGGLRKRSRHWTLFSAALVGIQWLVRPFEPYNHISTALPFTLFSALLLPGNSPARVRPFPFPDLLKPELWEAPRDITKGGRPSRGTSSRLTTIWTSYLTGRGPGCLRASSAGARQRRISCRLSLTRETKRKRTRKRTKRAKFLQPRHRPAEDNQFG